MLLQNNLTKEMINKIDLKKILMLVMAVFVIFTSSVMPVAAAESSRSYEIDLTVNGNHEVRANPGDVLTITMTLRRTDSSDAAKMYAMQDEIRYDPKFFEILDQNNFSIDGIEMTDIGLIDDYHAFYVNYISLSGGQEWDAETVIGNLQFKVIGEQGSSKLKSENCQVSLPDGSGSYNVNVNDLLVIVSTECIVDFDSMGGSEIESQKVLFGEHILKPEDPVREGYTFNGWYKDIYLKEIWDFEEDMVSVNMGLYAGWQEGVTATANDSFEFPWWIIIVLLYIIIVIYLIIRIYKKRNRKK